MAAIGPIRRCTARCLIALPVLLIVADDRIVAAADRDRDPASSQERVLFGSTEGNDAARWRIVDDGVMGGRSRGNVNLTNQQTLLFSGRLSLANNGGFSSLRSRPVEMGLAEWDALVIRLRGDGRSYFLNAYVPTRRVAFSYRAPIKTEPNEWREVRIPIRDLKPTSYGRPIRGAASVDQSRIQSLGFTIADKQAGQFLLEISWIKAVRDSEP